MLNKRAFWLTTNIGLSLYYLVALAIAVNGEPGHWVVLVALAILGIHVLEVPHALRLLKGQGGATGRIVAGTVLFGVTWWLPAKRGLYRSG